MSVKQLFVGDSVDYLLPSTSGASVGDSIVLAAGGGLEFSSAPPSANPTLSVNYDLSIAGGALATGFEIQFYSANGTVTAVISQANLATAVAGSGNLRSATFAVAGAVPPGLAALLPASGQVCRIGTVYFCDSGDVTTTRGDITFNSAGGFTFTSQNTEPFVTGTDYVIGINTAPFPCSFTLGSWVSA